MKARILFTFAALSAAFIASAFGQTTLKDFVGTWTLVSVTLEKDGKATDLYGPNPKGYFSRDADGHVFVVITRADLPKFAANNRTAGTPEENKAIVQGSLAYFATSTVDKGGTILTDHIETCTFPNWNGTDRRLTFTLNGDMLDEKGLSTTSTGSGLAHLVWKRVNQ